MDQSNPLEYMIKINNKSKPKKQKKVGLRNKKHLIVQKKLLKTFITV